MLLLSGSLDAQDWPNLARYAGDNAQLLNAPVPPGRVVFMGDSITDFWGRTVGKFFPGKPYVNRGISGQTTPQMLIRFRPDVIALRPAVVVILAGTNDIAGNTGPESLEQIEGNLLSMLELAKANHITPVLATLTPVCDCYSNQTAKRPPEKIRTLNAWIKDQSVRGSAVLLDYFPSTADSTGMFKKSLTDDGLHPNAAGYEVMGPLASAAIAKAFAHR